MSKTTINPLKDHYRFSDVLKYDLFQIYNP